MKINKFRITVSSPCDREKLVADVIYEDVQLAEVSQEEGPFVLQIYFPQDTNLWELPFHETINALKTGKNRLDALNEENASFTYVFDDLTENPLEIDTSSWLLSCYLLDFDKTLFYVTSYLKEKKSLSAELENIDFSKGHFFTLLPEGVKEDTLYQFTDMGVLPSEKWPSHPSQSFAKIFFERENWIKTPTLRLLRKWMIERNESFICESIDAKFSDIKHEVYHESAIHLNDELYYRVKHPKNDWRLLRETFYWTASSDFVGVLFKEEKGLIDGQEIQEKAFCQIASSASLVLVGAYNCEGYIFWQKDPFDLRSIGLQIIQ